MNTAFQKTVFYFYCRAFPSVNSDNAFVTVGFESWKKINKLASIHNKSSSSHKEAMIKYSSFNSVKKSGSVEVNIDNNHRKVVKENR